MTSSVCSFFLCKSFSWQLFVHADRSGIGDFNAVDRVRSRLLRALECQLLNQHPLQQNLFSITMSFLPRLHSISASHYSLLGHYRVHWQHLSNLPPLFAELFDIPVSPEEEEENGGGIVFSSDTGF
jgi:hypothetical protein